MQRILSCALLAATASAPAFAQNGFLPIGNQIMDGSQNMVTVNLGFNFTMPGGTVVSSVDVDEHGRIVEVGTDPSDGTETIAKLIGNPGASICALWDFTSYNSADNSTVFFDTDNSTRAVITWVNVNTPVDCTFQMQLWADGRIVTCYDSRCPVDDGIIGLSPGNGAPTPTQVDLITAVGSAIVTTEVTVVEDFDFSGPTAFDIPSTALEFIPTGIGGSGGYTIVGNGGVADPITPFAFNTDLGDAGCPAGYDPSNAINQTYFFIPDGAGNYDITAGPSVFDPNIGTDLMFTADDTKQTDFDLGFQFPWPSGLDNLVDIDPNGRILPSNSTDGGDFSPTPGEHDDAEAIAVFWNDFNVNEPGSGNVHLITNPGVSATITWNDVKQFDPSDSVDGMTVQVTLFPDGSFWITHQDIGAFNDPAVGTSARDLLVGFSDGSGVDPGEIDLTNLPVSVPVGVNYEWWDCSGTSPLEPTDLLGPYLDASYLAELVGVTTPVTGTNWEVQAQDVGATTLGFYVIGLGQQTLNLSAFGCPCNLLVTNDVVQVALPDGLGDLTALSIPIPNDPSLTGGTLYVQAAIDNAPVPPFGNFAGLSFLQISFSNAIGGTIGTL